MRGRGRFLLLSPLDITALTLTLPLSHSPLSKHFSPSLSSSSYRHYYTYYVQSKRSPHLSHKKSFPATHSTTIFLGIGKKRRRRRRRKRRRRRRKRKRRRRRRRRQRRRRIRPNRLIKEKKIDEVYFESVCVRTVDLLYSISNLHKVVSCTK